jgi:hypothetical protein
MLAPITFDPAPLKFGLTLALALGAVCASAPAQCEVQTLTASTGASGDDFGEGVSISGDVAVVGAERDDDAASNAGTAFVYRFDGASWQEETTLLPAAAGSNDHFGFSVAGHGDLIAVGAPDDDALANSAGSVYLFRHVGAGVWQQEDHVFAGDPDASDRFGWDVAVHGDVLLVGAKGDDEAANSAGAAYIFRDDGLGNWSEELKLTASDALDFAQFGDAVSLSANVAVIGAWQDSGIDTFAGAAYIYREVGVGVWNEETKLTASDAGAFQFFGRAVDIDGSRVVVGAYAALTGTVETGAAYVFDDSGGWGETQKLVASGGADGDRFGWAVAVHANAIAVGAYQRGPGTVYLFELAGAWSETTSLGDSNGVNGDELGESVALDGARIIAGAVEGTGVVAGAGNAVVFSTGAECGAAQTYCNPGDGSPNNTSTISISAFDLSPGTTVDMANGPAGQFGYLLLGNNNGVVNQPPGSEANLCVLFGSCFGRYAGDITQVSGGGTLSTDISNSASAGSGFAIPTCGGSIMSGQTWYFQYWHRQGSGLPSRFSEALAVTFQ